MSSSPALEPSSPSTTPSSPSLRPPDYSQVPASTPNFNSAKRPQHHTPLSVILPSTAPSTPPIHTAEPKNEPTLTPPPRSPGAPGCGDARSHPPDGTSSDKSSETAVGTVTRTPSSVLSRKESYKAQRQHYRREKKRATSALLHSIEDPAVVVLADWLKVRGSLKSWTKLWCVLKPGLLLLYKTPKAKSSQWVGTVLLTSCQVIERPSKKDGFCFKLYHPLEQSIWAPRGPHNETIGAVVQPLPTAHLIFRAPSPAAGHCWLDGLELALRCSNAMLRCSRSRPEQTITVQEPATETNLSHEELEKHFNEHVVDMSSSPAPLMSVSDYSSKRSSSAERKLSYQIPKKSKTSRKTSKWTQFMESMDFMSKENDTTDSESEKHESKFLDFLKKKEISFDRNEATTSSMRTVAHPKILKQTSISLASSPKKIDAVKRSPILKCFDLPKLPLTLPLPDKKVVKGRVSPTNFVEDNLIRFMSSFPKRRSSTPSTLKSVLTSKRISELRDSGAKTDSENDDVFLKSETMKRKKVCGDSELICSTPENIIITKTAPSIERFRKYSSSSTDEINDDRRHTPTYRLTPDKYSLIDYQKLPSDSFEALRSERRMDRLSSQSVYVTGKVVTSELAGAGSDSDSDAMHDDAHDAPTAKAALERLHGLYVPDTNMELGQAGELVEEVAEENKSLLWFLLKQVRPGMDLSKVVLPTFILEPRSFLDKLSDSYYHADILALSMSQRDPYDRFRCVLRWYLSGFYRKPKGLKKPYNPVLGEVFRCCWRHPDDEENYTFYISEQVSHHPPVSAFYVSNKKKGYVIEGSLLARSKFYGNSTSALLEGCARVHLLPWNETYITTAPYAHCKGLVIGTLSMELGGKVQLICNDTGYHADMEFKLRSFLSGSENTNVISGRIKKGKDVIATVDGYWDGRIDIKDKKTGESSTIIDVAQLKMQRLPRYLVDLSGQRPYESQRLWSKVSEAIANDDQVEATTQKTIIEESQRARARDSVTPWEPQFFHLADNRDLPDNITDQGWKYNHIDTTPWHDDDQLEYEEEFVIKTLRGNAGALRGALDAALLRPSTNKPPTDSDSLHQLSEGRSKARFLKRTLYDIDEKLRENNLAIERLTRTVEALSEGQRNVRRAQNMGRMPVAAHSWDLFAGFVLAMVLQAILNWLFYHNNTQ